MTSPYTHISLDIETTSTNPDQGAIIQIGAVRFNPNTAEIDLDFFNRCLRIPESRHWSESTRDWWLNYPDILQSIFQRMEDPRQVMTDLVRWAGKDMSKPPILVAKPISFEAPFIESYCRLFELPVPWRYWEALDLRSFTQGRGNRFLDSELPFDGNPHDALDDAIHQMATLLKCIETTGPLP